MRFKVERHGIRLEPECEQDHAYVEDTLGLRRDGDGVALVRRNVFGASSLAYVSTPHPGDPRVAQVDPLALELMRVCQLTGKPEREEDILPALRECLDELEARRTDTRHILCGATSPIHKAGCALYHGHPGRHCARFLENAVPFEESWAEPTAPDRGDENARSYAAGPPGPKPTPPQWIVNDIGELGVRVNGRCYFMYKGRSLDYDDNDPPAPSGHRARFIGKREFGEVCRSPRWTTEEAFKADVSPDNPWWPTREVPPIDVKWPADFGASDEPISLTRRGLGGFRVDRPQGAVEATSEAQANVIPPPGEVILGGVDIARESIPLGQRSGKVWPTEVIREWVKCEDCGHPTTEHADAEPDGTLSSGCLVKDDGGRYCACKNCCVAGTGAKTDDIPF